MLKIWLHIWIPHPKISRSANFCVSISNTSAEIEFWPFLPLYAQIRWFFRCSPKNLEGYLWYYFQIALLSRNQLRNLTLLKVVTGELIFTIHSKLTTLPFFSKNDLKTAKVSQNIDFQTLFLMWFWISVKFPFQRYMTWPILARLIFFYMEQVSL